MGARHDGGGTSTPASVAEILIGKLLPYFALGMLATLGATALAVFAFGALRGSLAALLLLSATFMVPALGQGLLISSITRNQFLAAQIALFSGFLPAFMLSGFLYEIDAMPAPIRAITWFIPARYFVSSLKTVFLAGDIWVVFVPNLLAMAAIGFLFFVLANAPRARIWSEEPWRNTIAISLSPGCGRSSSRKC